MGYIQRHLQEAVLQLSEEYPVLLVAGPRASGKTSMLRMLMEMEEALPEGSMERMPHKGTHHARSYVSLDNLRERELAQKDPEKFLQMHPTPVLISEIQYAPELLLYIKKILTKKTAAGSYWLTASHLYETMDAAYKALGESVALLNLFPYSRAEIAGVDAPPFSVKEYKEKETGTEKPFVDATALFNHIWRGCMPELIDKIAGSEDAQKDWDEYYAEYLETCIRRDVRDIGGAVEPIKFMRFISCVAARAGQLLNVKAIAQGAEIDQVTAKNWLGILANIGFIFYLHPIASDALKRAVKTPKLYFYDTGLVCYLTKWTSPETARFGAMADQLFENYIVSEIVKGYSHHGAVPRISYYRDRDGAEINLIFEEDKFYPVQIKLTGRPVKRMTSAFAMLEKAGLDTDAGAVICLADEKSEIAPELISIPVGEV